MPLRAKPTQLMPPIRCAWGGSQSAIARRSATATTGIGTLPFVNKGAVRKHHA